MRFNLGKVVDRDSFVSVPEGTHLCRVAEVRPGLSRDGSQRWSYRLEVAAGEYAGRTAAWDSLTWSERGVIRVKRVLAAFGFDVSGEVELEAHDLVGLQALVQVQKEEWEDPITGRKQERLTVPFLGYQPANGEAANGAGESPAGPVPGAAAEEPF